MGGMANGALQLILALLGHSLKTVSQSAQRIAMHRLPVLRRPAIWLWLLSTLGTGYSVVVLLAAVSAGPVAVVGATSGSGLVIAALFSRFVSGEQVKKQEIIGIGAISISLVLVGIFTVPETSFQPRPLHVAAILGIITSLYAIPALLLIRSQALSGAFFSGIAGILAGFTAIFQKLSFAYEGSTKFILTLSWILLSILSFLIMQLALYRCDSILAVPVFYGHFTCIPVIGGVYFFGESLNPIQWFGALGALTATVYMASARIGMKQSGKVAAAVLPGR